MQAAKPMCNYDKTHDTLYIEIGNRRNFYGDDSIPRIVLLRDIFTDAVTGVTILRFLKSCEANALSEFPTGGDAI